MDVAIKAIALKSYDYRENDKFILLYSLEYGKISVLAKGVRKSSAKLKFAADQFCFGLYELSKTDDRFTLKTCEQLESFYSLREKIEVYYAACVVAECLVNYTEDGQADGVIFAETLRALQSLINGAEPNVVVLRFLLGFMKHSGFALQLSQCIDCGERISKAFLDYEKGGMTCENCRTINSISVSGRAVSACKMVDGLQYDKLVNVNFTSEILKDALSFVGKYVARSFSPLKSLSELLKL